MKIGKLFGYGMSVVAALALGAQSASAGVLLYAQDFEKPVGFYNEGFDVNISSGVNSLYGGQPAGFNFAQAGTVETLYLKGNTAFGHGYSDPSGKGGSYALGMQQVGEDDLLGLSFSVGPYKFLNLRLDLSRISISGYGCGCDSRDDPIFQFSLYDNPGGVSGLGRGALLSQVTVQIPGSPSSDLFNWTETLVALNALGNTDGNVTLRIDLVNSGYAALDNFRIAASDTAGDVASQVPEPGAFSLAALGVGMLYRRRWASRSGMAAG
ncbi:hypothetical protein [Zoogloea sp.]|uniref:hypothetical protein n=1 Tax=Zoogloea sp. TaxID=49181 RepID=UPI0035B42783